MLFEEKRASVLIAAQTGSGRRVSGTVLPRSTARNAAHPPADTGDDADSLKPRYVAWKRARTCPSSSENYACCATRNTSYRIT